jgi:cytoskeletal protein RodZ
MPMPNLDLYRRAVTLLMQARKAQGMTIADVAAKLGFALDFVEAYETGCWRLDPAEYVAIARLIGVDPHELLQQAEEEVGWGRETT